MAKEPSKPKKKKKKSKRGPGFLKTLGHRLAYGLFRTFEAGLKLLPLGLVCRLGRIGGGIAWAFMGSYRELVRRNMRLAYGESLGPQQLSKLTREHFQTLGANLLAALKIPVMKIADVESRVNIEGIRHIEEAAKAGKGFVYAICHMGCWEVLSQMPKICPGAQPGTLFQPLGNPFLNAHVARLRSRAGFRLFSRNDGFHAPVQFLRDGNGLGVLVDQHAGDGGLWTPLFGRLASTTNLAALLAARTGAPIIPLGCVTDTERGPGYWKITLGEPLRPQGTRGDIEQLTAQLNQLLESVIRQSPADWFWVHDRWKTPKPNFLLAKYKRGVVLPSEMETSSLKPFEMFVRAPNWLGDACMSLPAVRALKRGRPDARITILTPAKLADFWRAVAEVDEVITKEAKEGIFAVRKTIRGTGRQYDVAILFTGTNSLRSVFEVRGCGIPRIVSYGGKWRKYFVNQIVPDPNPGPVEHHVWHFLRMAEHLGADVDDSDLLEPLAEAPQRGTPGKLQVGLCAGAEYGSAKRWPLERFAEMAQAVRKETKCQWVLLGAPSETALGAELEAAIGKPVKNLVGKTSLAQLMQELWRCQLVVTNDTGTMHLAASLGVPTVSIFGSTDPEWTGPVGRGHTIIRRHAECSPCFKRECPIGDFRCMMDITVESVVRTVVARLQKLTAKPQSSKRR